MQELLNTNWTCYGLNGAGRTILAIIRDESVPLFILVGFEVIGQSLSVNNLPKGTH